MLPLSSICKYYSAALLFIFFSATASAQNKKAITVNGYDAAFNTNINTWLATNTASSPSATRLVLLQFGYILSSAEKQNLAARHIYIQEYMGAHTYNAWVSASSDFSTVPAIEGIAAFLPEYKIVPAILQKSKSESRLRLLVSFFSGINKAQILDCFGTHNASVIADKWEKKGLYTIEISATDLLSLASFYGVKFISEPSQNIPLDLSGKNAQGASLATMPSLLGGIGLTGKNVFVGIGDNCSGIYHIDQSDRVINYNNGKIDNHGVLVNGILAGEGIMDKAGQGIATEGTCINLFFDAVLLLKEEMYKGFNATLTNNSYAAIVRDCAYSGTYDNLSQNLDEMAFNTTEQLDVFAAGNDGTLTCSYPAGYANICGGYQTAKNILTVGSCFLDYKISATSSRGPLRDGRIKPEICAAGATIYCPIPGNKYMINSGTSLACPQVTGVLALLTERYKQLNADANPKSDLLKAIAINGASDLGRPGPDFWYGFGFINGIRSLGIIENNWYARNTIVSGAADQKLSINVPANTAQLKVLLYYHDAAASASAAVQLVNDIDLTVTEPGGKLHHPLILNPAISGVTEDAAEGTDHLNNAEQVTINNPDAGIYTVSVADFAIPSGTLDYIIAYDIIPAEIKLLFPVANATAAAKTDLYIYWEAPSDATASTKVEFSDNGGSSWISLATAVEPNTRVFKWAVPGINSNQCKIKISSGGKVSESGLFIINELPVVKIAAMQCPGSVAINWTSVPNADKYFMLLKKGAHFEKVDSVNAGTLAYNFTGLSTTTDYYVAVMPAIAGMDGFRSKAATRKPNSGTCGAAADGDIAIEAIVAPESGRRYTSSALTAATAIKVNIRNQDDFAISNYSVSYKVNSGAWKTIPSFSIAANTTVLQLIDLYDFSSPIDYEIKIAVENNDRLDPVKANDTLVKVIRHIANNPLSLLTPITNNFESLADLTLLKDSIGLSDDGFWDYSNSNDTGRFRSRIPGSKLVTSNRSVSMDVNMNAKENVNYFTGTFNLSNYDTSADEVRFDFDYEMRGMPVLKDSNKVWIRGSDKDLWLPVSSYNNSIDTAKLHESGTLSLRDAFRMNGQNFSACTQVRFGQFDSTVIVEDYYGGGVTIDNVSIYKVLKDLQLSAIVSPEFSLCDVSTAPVMIKIKNGTKNEMKDIVASYSVDGKSAVTETLTSSILGDDSIVYKFSKALTDLTLGAHTLSVWIHSAGDDFLKNDTIHNFNFYISPMVESFPYLQDFETSNGDWYASGKSSSWAYGIPSGKKINTAASGQKVWKTNLSGNYNSNEISFLNAPCINTVGLANPMLSFSTAFDIESCDTNACDRVFIEYSVDNEQSWERLGTNNTGTNWYNNKDNTWNGSQTHWHVASATLPRASQLKLRFALVTDMGLNLEGFAIDDIHIFDFQKGILNLESGSSRQSEGMVVNGTALFYFTENDKIICAANPLGENFGLVKSTVFAHEKWTDPVSRQYHLPRSWVMQSDNAKPSKTLVRLYITDEEVNKILADTSCKTCSKALDIYRNGVTQFFAKDGKNEDSSLHNNQHQNYYEKVKWVPYDNGYYTEFEANGLGEFWINDGGILATLPLNTEYILFNARKINDDQAAIQWLCPIDTQINKFTLERSFDSNTFTAITEITSRKSVSETYAYLDNPAPAENARIYYRLLGTAMNGKTFYSDVIAIDWIKGNKLLRIYPVPSADGKLTVKWTGGAGTSAKYSIIDAGGRIVRQSELKSENWVNYSTINMDDLAKGMYYIKFKIAENEYLEKVLFK